MTNNIYWSKSRQKNAQRPITTDNYGMITSTDSTDKYAEKYPNKLASFPHSCILPGKLETKISKQQQKKRNQKTTNKHKHESEQQLKNVIHRLLSVVYLCSLTSDTLYVSLIGINLCSVFPLIYVNYTNFLFSKKYFVIRSSTLMFYIAICMFLHYIATHYLYP